MTTTTTTTTNKTIKQKLAEFIDIYKNTPYQDGDISIFPLKTYTQKDAEYFIKVMKDCYYNKTPIVNDNCFDLFEEFALKTFPSMKQKTGSEPKKSKIKLPYFMGSLNKIKHTNPEQVIKWCSKYNIPQNYILQPKMDGVSGMLIIENGNTNLFTRGDGTTGQNVSHLLRYLTNENNILNNLTELSMTTNDKTLCLRGEFIISIKTFEEKYKTQFANCRNMISGLINQKATKILNPQSPLYDINFIVYEIIHPQMSPLEQMNLLNRCFQQKTTQSSHFTNPESTRILITPFYAKQALDCCILTEVLEEWKATFPFEIDGIVVKHDRIYERETDENPKHQFAFKMNVENNCAISKVIDVIWNPSKDGYLKPQVIIEQVYLDGVFINYTTGFNASYIKTHKIGPDALLKIMRSGSVIPHIVEVIEPSPTGEKMPTDISYKWTDTNIDIMLDCSSNGINISSVDGNDNTDSNYNSVMNDNAIMEVVIKNMVFFFKGIGVDCLGIGLIRKLVQNGFNSIEKIMNMTIPDYLKIEGFKITLATKIHNNIQEKIKSVSIVFLMSSSNLFGRGISTKRIETIIANYPDILKMYSQDSEEHLISIISNIKGFQEKTARSFVKGIPRFNEFIKKCGISLSSSKSNDIVENMETEKNNETIINNENDDITTTSTPTSTPISTTVNNTNEKEQIYKKIGLDCTQTEPYTFLITGFRNEEITNKIKSLGFKEITSLSKNTVINLLLIKDENYENTKTKKIIETNGNCHNNTKLIVMTMNNIRQILNL